MQPEPFAPSFPGGRVVAVFAALLLSGTLYAEGETAAVETHSRQIVARLNRYEVKPQYEEQFRKALGAYVTRSLPLESNIMSEAYYEQKNPAVLWLIERWTSGSELEGINRSPEAKAVGALTEEALVKPVESIYVEDLEPLSKQQWRRTAKAEDSPLTIMLFVDAREGTQDEFMARYHAAMPEFRGEPGVVTYQLSQVENDRTKFVTFEKFRSDAAFDYHLKFPAVNPIIDYLNTSIKQQPFQTGLRTLIEFAPLTRESGGR